MQVSAEIRWFWPKACPPEVQSQFHRRLAAERADAPRDPQTRNDVYFAPAGQSELGVKKRDGRPGLEVKGLVAIAPLAFGGSDSRCEIWSKWKYESEVSGTREISTRKSRWFRKFDTSGGPALEIALGPKHKPLDGRQVREGCNLELTKVEIKASADQWWTLGFEAFGSLDKVRGSLEAAIAAVGLAPDVVADGLCMSYPAWIDHAYSAGSGSIRSD